MKGSRSKDNFYMCISQPSSKVKSIEEIISEDVLNDFPKLMIEEDKICVVCQKSKMSHIML